jgi:hypothetical protein
MAEWIIVSKKAYVLSYPSLFSLLLIHGLMVLILTFEYRRSTSPSLLVLLVIWLIGPMRT